MKELVGQELPEQVKITPVEYRNHLLMKGI
jgi:hypothetical protein